MAFVQFLLLRNIAVIMDIVQEHEQTRRCT